MPCPQLWSRKVNEVTRILSAIEQGNPNAAEELLPLVYDELRRLASQKLAHDGRLPKNWSRCYVSPPGIVQGGTHEQAKDR